METAGCLDETVWNLVKRVNISLSLSVFLSLSISFFYLRIYLCILFVSAFVHSDFVVSDSRGSPAFWMWSLVCFIISTINLPLFLFNSIYLYLSYLVSISLYLSLLSIIFLCMSLSATLCPSIYLSVSPDLYVSLNLFLFYLWISLSLFALSLPVYFPLSWNMCMPTCCFGFLGHTSIPNVFLQTLWPWLLIDA